MVRFLKCLGNLRKFIEGNSIKIKKLVKILDSCIRGKFGKNFVNLFRIFCELKKMFEKLKVCFWKCSENFKKFYGRFGGISK